VPLKRVNVECRGLRVGQGENKKDLQWKSGAASRLTVLQYANTSSLHWCQLMHSLQMQLNVVSHCVCVCVCVSVCDWENVCPPVCVCMFKSFYTCQTHIWDPSSLIPRPAIPFPRLAKPTSWLLRHAKCSQNARKEKMYTLKCDKNYVEVFCLQLICWAQKSAVKM